MSDKVKIKTYAIPKGYVSTAKVKKNYTVSTELLEDALAKMGFRESERTTTTKQYRRSDGLHVILTKRRKRKLKETPLNDKHARVTILKIHKDSENHKIITKWDHKAFFAQLDKAIVNARTDMQKELLPFIKGLALAGKGMLDPHYFQLPVAGEEAPIFRERVYCYELYHNLRNVLGNDFSYKLDGEVDKNGHPQIPGKKKPDFIVHRPGGMKGNLVVIEVKPVTVSISDLDGDLKKLTWLLDIGKYRWAIMLIYGSGVSELPKRILSRVKDFSGKRKHRILLAWHPGWGKEVEIVNFKTCM
jgi:hypothetical protein